MFCDPGKSHTTLGVTFPSVKQGEGRRCRIENWQLLAGHRASAISGKAGAQVPWEGGCRSKGGYKGRPSIQRPPERCKRAGEAENLKTIAMFYFDAIFCQALSLPVGPKDDQELPCSSKGFDSRPPPQQQLL